MPASHLHTPACSRGREQAGRDLPLPSYRGPATRRGLSQAIPAAHGRKEDFAVAGTFCLSDMGTLPVLTSLTGGGRFCTTFFTYYCFLQDACAMLPAHTCASLPCHLPHATCGRGGGGPASSIHLPYPLAGTLVLAILRHVGPATCRLLPLPMLTSSTSITTWVGVPAQLGRAWARGGMGAAALARR